MKKNAFIVPGILVMLWQAASSAPLVDEKIYFPGETPTGDTESRIYHGYSHHPLTNNFPVRVHHHSSSGSTYQSSYEGSHHMSGVPNSMFHYSHMNQNNEGQSEGKFEGSPFESSNSNFHEGNEGGNHQRTQHQFSPGQQLELLKPEFAFNPSSGIEQNHPSQGYTSSNGENAFVERESQNEHREYNTVAGKALHPSIQKALDNIMSSIEETPQQNQKQTVHHFTHLTHTTHEKKGNALNPTKIVRIQKTKTVRPIINGQNTNTKSSIDISQLIEELHQLESSSNHRNVTWCEEKIKEFLYALRQKQAQGIIIDQKTQEETLHHILTEDQNTYESGGVQSESVENENESVYEAPFVMKTAILLGQEGSVKSPSSSHHHYNLSHSIWHHTENNNEPSSNEFNQITNQNLVELKVPDEEERHHHVHEKEKQLIAQPPPFVTGHSSAEKSELMENSEKNVQFQPFQENVAFREPDELDLEWPPYPDSAPKNQPEDKSPLHHEQQQETYNSEQSENSQGGMHHEQHTKLSSHDSKMQNSENTNDDQFSDHENNEEQWVGENQQGSMSNENEGAGQIIKDLSTGESSSSYGQSVNIHAVNHSYPSFDDLSRQQINYETLIQELIQLESLPGHQAIDKCEEKIKEFLEILRAQQELGFGKNQRELERLHQTIIDQAEARQHQLGSNQTEGEAPSSFWKRVGKNIKTTYQKAKNHAKTAINNVFNA